MVATMLVPRQSTPPAPAVALAHRSTTSSSSARSLALRLPAKGREALGLWPWPSLGSPTQPDPGGERGRPPVIGAGAGPVALPFSASVRCVCQLCVEVVERASDGV